MVWAVGGVVVEAVGTPGGEISAGGALGAGQPCGTGRASVDAVDAAVSAGG